MPTFTMRFALIAVLAMFAQASVARADPEPDFAKTFNLVCSDGNTYQVVFVESNLGTFHVLGSTSIFQCTSLTIEGTLIFAEPGFAKNGIPQLTGTFIGVVTGRHFTVTGFFTPPRT